MGSNVVDALSDQLANTAVEEDRPVGELSFAGRHLKLDGENDAKEIVEAIEKFENLVTLRMDGNTMGIGAAQAIGRALQKHPEFERALWSDMFTGRLKSEIPIALQHLGSAMTSAGAHLVELDLSDNAFGPNGVNGFKDLLKSPVCYTLEELYLNNNGLGVTGGKMLAESLIECHRRSTAAGRPLSLRVFIAGRNRLENEAGAALADAFRMIGTLEHIAMPQNGINPPGVRALADAIAANPDLRVINLNDNTFTADGARSMARVLPKLAKLEIVNFGDCLVRTEGAQALAEVFKSGLKNLREIVLSGNEIRVNGGVAVAESIEGKEALTKLDLSANCFGESGVELVTGVVDAMDRLDVLQSMSDDEGSSDEEEEDEDGEENDDDYQTGKESDLDDYIIVGGEVSPDSVTAADFLKFPSGRKLLALGDEVVSKFRSEIGNDNDHDIATVIPIAVRIASVATAEDCESSRVAKRCFDALVARLLDESETPLKNNALMTFANTLLVEMGLLKSEDKNHRSILDVSGVLFVLEHAVRQAYFPKSITEMLRIFVSRPHVRLENAKVARDRLLQALYSV